MAVYEQVGQAFIGHYYNCFDTNRAALGDLYQGESMCVVVKEAFMFTFVDVVIKFSGRILTSRPYDM